MRARITVSVAFVLIASAFAACTGSSSSTAPSTPAPPTASFTVTFDENPVPFRSSGCSFSTPQGWYTTAHIQEKSGVAFNPGALTQKLDGNVAASLSESFGSRFGACSGQSFTPGTIAANGSACGIVGICTSTRYGNYQFSIAGTDANGHAVTIDSPVLQFGAIPAGQGFVSMRTVAPGSTR
ncbi:MAG TPA: hypothetical protein VGY57_16905 [Vicinamibacterales bacterium]|nr:hypothetical protein [Vicinamibacterales bacterium]